MALLLLASSDSPCDGRSGGTLALDGSASMETSDSVGKKMIL